MIQSCEKLAGLVGSERSQFLPLLCLSWLLASCGMPPQFSHVLPSTPFDSLVVRHPTKQEIAEIKAQANGYIVAFRSEDRSEGLFFSDYLSEYRHHYGILDENFLADPRIKGIRYITSENLAPRGDTEWRAEFAPPLALQLAWDEQPSEALVAVVAKVDFASEAASRSLLAEWERDRRIWFAEPNYYSELSQTPTPTAAPAAPTDLFGKYKTAYDTASYRHISQIKVAKALGALSARDLSSSPSDQDIVENPPIVAVLDSGIDYTHPALKDRLWVNSKPGASGCADDLNGCDTTQAVKGSLGNGEVFPFGTTGPGQSCGQNRECEHGTHVSGIIIADPASGAGAGVCPVCQVMMIKVVQDIGGKGRVSDEAQLAGMKYLMRFTRANSNAVRVINSSFGKYSRSRVVGLLVSLLRRSGSGALVVSAAGNEDSMGRTYPAGLSDALAVAAVDSQGKKAFFSNFGPWVDIAAPGVDIVAPVPGGSSAPKSGTSMASPVTAGVAGLMVAANPSISFAALRDGLIKSADPEIYGQESAGGFNYDFYYVKIPGESIRRPLLGAGLVNTELAVQGKDSGGLIAPALDRVTPGCGTLKVDRHVAANAVPFFWWLGFPLLPLILLRRRSGAL